eukprot:Colp12_sorted_trinity150504_noHs@28152
MSDEELLDKLTTYLFTDNGLEEKLTEFGKKHSAAFKDLPRELDDAVKAEQKLEWQPIYVEFKHILEGLVTSFLSKEGVSDEQFAAIIEKHAGNPESQAGEVLEIITATSEYGVFLQLMLDVLNKA